MIVLFGVTLSAFIGLLVYLLTVTYTSQLLQEITFSTHRLAEAVRSGIRYDMLVADRHDVQNAVDAISKQREIDRIRVLNKEGKIISSSDRSEVGMLLDRHP